MPVSKNAFVRRQRPGLGFRTNGHAMAVSDCVRACEQARQRCSQACDCSAADNDLLVSCIDADCGRTAFSSYRDDLIVQCPRAFDYNRRPGERVGQRPEPPRPPIPTPRPAPEPAPAPAPTPRPPATRLPATTGRPAPSSPSNPKVQSPHPLAQPSHSPPASPVSPVREISDSVEPVHPGESDSNAIPTPHSQVVLTTISTSATTESLLPQNAPTESLNFVISAVSLPSQSSNNNNEGEEERSSESNDQRSSSISQWPTVRSTSSTGQVSSGIPILSPLDPSSPGKIESSNASIIAGIIIGVLAVISMFLVFWYRSRLRRQRASLQSSLISSPMPGRNDESASKEAWMQFGGAKGSMISPSVEEDSEKNPPIYNMFSRRALPLSPTVSSVHGRQSVSSPSQSSFRFAGRRASVKGLLSSTRPTRKDDTRSPPPSYHGGNSEELPAPAYKRPAGTSFFARLLGNPIEREAAPGVSARHRSTRPSDTNVNESGNQTLQSLKEEEEPRWSECLDTSIRPQYRYTVDYGVADAPVPPHPSPMASRKTPIDSVYEEPSTMSFGRPSIAWSARSVPRDMSIFEEGDEAQDMRATSTRAPSLDLAWVTQSGDTRIPIPSWAAAPRRRPSMRSKKSSKSISQNHRSTFRHSVISLMSSRSSAAPSRSAHTSSSGPTRSAHSSTGPLPEMPAFTSIPSFRIEIGSDKAKAVLQLLANTPTTPGPNTGAAAEDSKVGNSNDLCRDESRPVSVCNSTCFSPGLRDSAFGYLVNSDVGMTSPRQHGE